jgi:hypothetical protein
MDRRAFWTKRKRAAGSMIAVLALVAGIAAAFKLFDRTVPANVVRDASSFDFKVQVFGPPPGGGAPRWNDAGAPPDVPIFAGGVDTYPGDERAVDTGVQNTNQQPRKDATFYTYVDPAIVVKGCTLSPDQKMCVTQPVVPTTDPNWAKFVGYWTLTIDKEKVLGTPLGGLNEDLDRKLTDLRAHPDSPGETTQACSGGLREITRASPCNLGDDPRGRQPRAGRARQSPGHGRPLLRLQDEGGGRRHRPVRLQGLDGDLQPRLPGPSPVAAGVGSRQRALTDSHSCLRSCSTRRRTRANCLLTKSTLSARAASVLGR